MLAIVLALDFIELAVDSLSSVEQLISDTDMSSLPRPSSSKSSILRMWRKDLQEILVNNDLVSFGTFELFFASSLLLLANVSQSLKVVRELLLVVFESLESLVLMGFERRQEVSLKKIEPV